MEELQSKEVKKENSQSDIPSILEEIIIEEIFVDGICGVY